MSLSRIVRVGNTKIAIADRISDVWEDNIEYYEANYVIMIRDAQRLMEEVTSLGGPPINIEMLPILVNKGLLIPREK